MPWDIRWHPKTTKKEGEMKVWVGCARGVQVAYVTLHHRGCTLVPPSTWAKRVPRVRPCNSTTSGTSLGPRATKGTPQATGGRGPKTSRNLPARQGAITPQNANGGHHPEWVPHLARTEVPYGRFPRGGSQAVLTAQGCKAARQSSASRQGTPAAPAAAAARRLPRLP